MREPPDIRLELVNREDSVAAVAAALDGVATVLELDALDADAIQTAVAEACKNVVLHAYEGTEGPLEVELRVRGETVAVTVIDHGIGIRPHLGERRYPHNGLGLPMIHQHAWRLTYTNLPGGGTELRMEFLVEGTSGEADGTDLAGAVLGSLVGPLGGVADARVQAFVRPREGEQELLARLRERLGPELGGLAVDRLAAADGGGELVVLSLPGGR